MIYRIEWDGTPQRDLEEQLRAEISEFMGGDPRGLISHTMMVGGAEYGSDGPSVCATWDEERHAVVAEFFPVSEWVTLSDVKDKMEPKT